MTDEQRPGWLETLWNTNPRIAAEAEKELSMLYEFKEHALKTVEFINQIKSTYGEK